MGQGVEKPSFGRRELFRKAASYIPTVGMIGGFGASATGLTDELFAVEQRRKIKQLEAFGKYHNIPNVTQEAQQQLAENKGRQRRDLGIAGGGLLIAVLSLLASDKI
jgi:hypothetical protein